MEIKDFFKLMHEMNSGILTIGEMLDKLNNFEDDEKFSFSNGTFLDDDYGSYRGYYKDFYVAYSDKDKGFNTIGKLKEMLNSGLSDGVMYGYKGGEYPITEDTLVWLADYGFIGEMIVDVQKVNGEIFVITKED